MIDPQASVVNRDAPLAAGQAWRAVARCVGSAALLLADRRVHLPRERIGIRLSFANDSSAVVYRETVVDRAPPADPAILVVQFRLRGVRGRGHTVFRRVSLLNTPLFVGFPGFFSKLWLANDASDVYRGVYQWDGAARAEAYARALWRVLALVSERGSIHYRVVPGLRRVELLADPGSALDRAVPAPEQGWWRLVGVG